MRGRTASRRPGSGRTRACPYRGARRLGHAASPAPASGPRRGRSAGREQSADMITVSWDTVRLFLHVLAATVWVGGQLTLAALVPALRGLGAEVPKAAARRFNQVAWPAFAVLVATGVWNVIAESDKDTLRLRTPACRSAQQPLNDDPRRASPGAGGRCGGPRNRGGYQPGPSPVLTSGRRCRRARFGGAGLCARQRSVAVVVVPATAAATNPDLGPGDWRIWAGGLEDANRPPAPELAVRGPAAAAIWVPVGESDPGHHVRERLRSGRTPTLRPPAGWARHPARSRPAAH